jgi:hypothetical protein
MARLGGVEAPRGADLDLAQELILIRRFEEAIASLAETAETAAAAGVAQRQAHHEFERTWRIATNMRGHLR